MKVVLVVVMLLIALIIFMPSLGPHRQSRNEAAAMGTLRTLLHGQELLRVKDSDGNGKKDYWTADVAGFYALPKKDGGPLALIDVRSATADAAPLRGVYSWAPPERPEPRAGYYFRAMSADETGASYRKDADGDGKKYTNPDKYAFCAYPARYGKTGFRTYIMNETGVIYGRHMNGEPVDTWPAEDPSVIEGLDNPWHQDL